MRALSLLLLVGCAEGDPCDGKPGACLTVSLSGAVAPLDAIDADVRTPSGALHHAAGATTVPAIELPVQFALRLPDDAAGDLSLTLSGLVGTFVIAQGNAAVTLPPRGHGRVSVVLAPLGTDPGGRDLGLDSAPPSDAASDAATNSPDAVHAPVWVNESLPLGPHFSTVWAASPSEVFAGGGDEVYRRDASGVWIPLAQPVANREILKLVGFSALELYAIVYGTGSVFHSLDGGRSWTSDVVSAEYLFYLVAVSDSELYASTSTGTIYRGAAGNWQLDRPAPSPYPYLGDGAVLGGVPCFAEGSTLLQRNGPSDWGALYSSSANLRSPWGVSLTDYYFVTTVPCASGSCEVLRHQHTKGLPDLMVPAGTDVTAIWGDGSDVYAVGERIFHTSDGATWNQEPMPTGGNLKAVSGAGGEVFAVGYSGLILHRR